MTAPSGTVTFWSLVESAADTRPDAPLLVDDDGRTLTCADFREAALSVAAGLHSLGYGAGTVLSWQLPTVIEAPVLMAACARLGIVQNPVIPLLRHREVSFIVAEIETEIFIAPETWRGFGYADMARDVGVEVLSLDLAAEPGTPLRLPTGDPGDLPPAPERADDCRWVYYSSGTTADPKGARHSDASVIAGSNGVVDGIGMTSGDRYPIAWPFAHIGGIAMLAAALRAGGCLVLFDTFDSATTPGRMAAHAPTILGSATPFFNAYIAAQREHGKQPLYPELRVCVAGGAPTPEVVNREVADVLGVPGIVGSWGLTEFPVATSETSDDSGVGTSVGRTTEGVEARVVDCELQLKGPQCFLGYVDARLDEEAFDDGWFRTGDLGRIDADGRIHIDGRSKDVIIRNAENVSAQEVEETLLRHAGVADVAVIGVPDPRTGERVCAVVVAAPAATLTLDMLVEHCRSEGLARYKWPERFEVVDQLPRNSMGKVLKRDLRQASA